jgi:tetratricopeptide (TPR) repeat protein
VAVLLAVVAALAASASAQPATRAACAGAERLVTQGQLDEAKAAYTKLATAADAPPCAARGLKTVKRRIAAATPTPDPCKGAKALAGQDLLDEAEKAYRKLAESDDVPECAATGLAAVEKAQDDGRGRAEAAGDWADAQFAALADWFKAAALLLGALILLVALALRYKPLTDGARRWAWLLERPNLSAGVEARRGKAAGRAAMTPIAWAVATPVKIEKLKGPGDEDGPAMTRALGGLLPTVAARRAGRLQLAVTPFAAKSALSQVTEAVAGAPHGKLVAAVLAIARRLAPREQLHVTGSVLASDNRGPGLALEIANDAGDVIDAETIWSKDFAPWTRPGDTTPDPESDRTLRLALAGAVWVLFAVLRYRRALREAEWSRHLGTPIWRSYAQLQIGVVEAASRSKLAAQAGYARALERDPGNLPALFNLANVDIERAEWHQAVERLERVTVELDEREAKVGLLDRDPLRYQVAYGLAYARLNRKSTVSPEDAMDMAKKLKPEVRRLEEALLKLDKAAPTPDHEELAVLLRRFEGPLLALYAYLLAAIVPGQRRSTGDERRPTRKQVIDRLDGDNPTDLHHADLVRGFMADHVSVGPGTQYNLASYYTRVDQRENARRALEASLELGTTAKDVDDDLQLRPLRAADREKFDKLLAEYRAAEAPEPTGLARIAAIGADHSRALARLGIETEEQLVAEAGTAPERSELARRLKVGAGLVERWARLADVRALGIDFPHVNLLDAAGVQSRGMLALVQPGVLRKLLDDVDPPPAGVEVPSEDTLADWIQRALGEPDRVRA